MSCNQCGSGGVSGQAFKVRITNASGALGFTRHLFNLPDDSGQSRGLPAASVHPSRDRLPLLRRYGQTPPLLCNQPQSSPVNEYGQRLTIKKEVKLKDKRSLTSKIVTTEFVKTISVRRPSSSTPRRKSFYRPDTFTFDANDVGAFFDNSV